MLEHGGTSRLVGACFVLSALAVAWGCGDSGQSDGGQRRGEAGAGGGGKGGSAGSGSGNRGGNAGASGSDAIGGGASDGGEPGGGVGGDGGGGGEGGAPDSTLRCVADTGIPLPEPMDYPSGCQETSDPAWNLADYGCITSSEPGEGGFDSAARVFDDNTGTTWSASSPTPWIGYEFPNDDAHAIVSYTVTSAGDDYDRGADPTAWLLQGSNDENGSRITWTTLDTREGESFTSRYETHTYSFENQERFRRYRFLVTENAGASGFRIAELELFAAGTPVFNVDSTVEGDGDNQFRFSSNWYGRTDDPTSGRYHGSTSWGNAEDATFSLTFVGSQVRMFGVFASHHGIGAFSIDGGEEIEIDQYGPGMDFNQLQLTSEKLCPGRHVLTGRVTGGKRAAATDYFVSVDRAQVVP